MERNALADAAVGQINGYPYITGKEQLKRLIREKLLKQKLAPADHFSWPNAMLGEGLLSAFEATGEKAYLLAVADYLKRWKKEGFRIYYVDNIMNGSLALRIEALARKNDGAIPKAGLADDEMAEIYRMCGETQEACAAWLEQAMRTEEGILPYRTHHPDWLFADTLGMVCPFLCGYGAQRQDEKLLRLGIRQLGQFIERGMDQRSGLPYHGYDEKNGLKYGIIGWGRACGWMMKGLAEGLPWIPDNYEEKKQLQQTFEKLLKDVFAWQRADGGFSWQIEALEGHRDSSAEGMIGAAVLSGIKNGLLFTDRNGADGAAAGKIDECATFVESESALKLLLHAAERSVKNNTVTDCSGECRGFAEYPQVFGSYPWGTGSVLSFLAQAVCIKDYAARILT